MVFAVATQKLDDEVQNLRAEIRKPVQAFPFWSESVQDSQHSLGLAFCSPYWISGMEENIREVWSLESCRILDHVSLTNKGVTRYLLLFCPQFGMIRNGQRKIAREQ